MQGEPDPPPSSGSRAAREDGRLTPSGYRRATRLLKRSSAPFGVWPRLGHFQPQFTFGPALSRDTLQQVRDTGWGVGSPVRSNRAATEWKTIHGSDWRGRFRRRLARRDEWKTGGEVIYCGTNPIYVVPSQSDTGSRWGGRIWFGRSEIRYIGRVASPRLGVDVRVPRSPDRGEVSARREIPMSAPSGGYATRGDRRSEFVSESATGGLGGHFLRNEANLHRSFTKVGGDAPVGRSVCGTNPILIKVLLGGCRAVQFSPLRRSWAM
ncbi:MAG: hypothetical protein JWO38_138 [Gemmataceae bacterium]|nr:hypothetical protein [Gemmataceae bacterium]